MATPVVTLAVSPDTAIAYPFEPALITATADVTFSGSTFVSAAFDWGDGSPVTTVALFFAQHQYTIAGSYPITVTILDSIGLTAAASKQVRIYREQVTLPVTPAEVPPRKQHTPLDGRHPSFLLRRPSGNNV